MNGVPDNLTDQLNKLSRLHAEGALSDGEFTAAKARLIGGRRQAPNIVGSTTQPGSDKKLGKRKSKAVLLAIVLGVVAVAAYVLFIRLLGIFFHDETLIRMKPTIVTIIFSVALLGSLKFGKPLLSMGFNRILKLTEAGWRTLTLRWGFFLFVLAVLNEIVWRTQPTDIWMAYNFHSHLTLTIAFALSQIPLILKSDPAVGPTYIERLRAARDSGAITDDEFQSKVLASLMDANAK